VGVDLGDGFSLIVGLALAPIDIPWTLLYGDMLEAVDLGDGSFATGVSSGIIRGSYAINTRLAIQEGVQCSYRPAKSGATGAALFVGVNEEMRLGLARLLREWGHTEATVLPPFPRWAYRNQAGAQHKAHAFLKHAGVPVKDPPERKLIGSMLNRLARRPVSRAVAMKWKDLPPIRLGGPSPGRPAREKAWAKMLEEGLIRRDGRVWSPVQTEQPISTTNSEQSPKTRLWVE
jgi:hypothetical protein